MSIKEVQESERIVAAATRSHVGDPAILVGVTEKIHQREAKRQAIRDALRESHSNTHDLCGGKDSAAFAPADEACGGSVVGGVSAASAAAHDGGGASVLEFSVASAAHGSA